MTRAARHTSTLVALVLGVVIGCIIATAFWYEVAFASSPAVGSHPARVVPNVPMPATPTEPPVSLDLAPVNPSPVATEPPAAIGGTATWYCSSSSACTRGYRPTDLVAAIDPALGIGKGALLRIHHEGRSVEVRVVDVCACKGERIIDLTSGAFVHLAPLSRGVIPVALEVVGETFTLPPTTTEETP